MRNLSLIKSGLERKKDEEVHGVVFSEMKRLGDLCS